MYKFKPDIIFISAGFDGHKYESINESNMLLLENDFGYIAEQIQFVANKTCNGKVVAVLEGGYNVNTGIISPFVQSVFKFIRHMNVGINILQDFDWKLTNHKREDLYNEEMELYKNKFKEELENEEKGNKPRRSERLRHIKLNEEKKLEEKKAFDEMNKINNEIKKEELKDNIDSNKEDVIKDEIVMKDKKDEIKNENENENKNEENENGVENKEKKEEIKEKKEEIIEKKEDSINIRIENDKDENDNKDKNEQQKELVNEIKIEDKNIEPKENAN